MVSAVIGDCLCKVSETKGAFHLLKISVISGSAVNGTRFVGSSHLKIPRKSGKSKRVGPELVFVLFLDYHLQCICGGGLIVDF